jgi:UrcA family protein
MERNAFKARNLVKAVLLVAALGLVAPVVSAAKVPTEKVRIADLDLGTAKGQKAFERRLRVALDRVCIRPNDHLPHTKSALRRLEECKATARSGALRQLQVHGIQLASVVP